MNWEKLIEAMEAKLHLPIVPVVPEFVLVFIPVCAMVNID